MTRHIAAMVASCTVVLAGNAYARMATAPKPPPLSHIQTARSVSQMVSDRRVRRMVAAKKLSLVNVTWEDTGRWQGSALGPNISDVTIEVEAEDKRGIKRRFLMPVIRYPNFKDKTGDVDIDKFFLKVGNQEKGGKLKTITLKQLLANPLQYMSLPNKGSIKGNTLLAKRDSKVLTSAQTAFLPIRNGGKTRFWPVIFNYQSYAKNPAVLTILVTRQGTSMTIVDNNRDTVNGAGSWGQRLYFNAGGKRAPLMAERLKDVKAKGTTMNGGKASDLGGDSNMVMLIQVPLKVKPNPRRSIAFSAGYDLESSKDMKKRSRGGSNIGKAVIGHGPTEGPYTELDGLTIERDARFPVRVTVQFYQATSNGVVNKANVASLAAQINKVYAKADYVGSLVVPSAADRKRATNWNGVTKAPGNVRWDWFPGLVERYNRYGNHVTFGTYGIGWYLRI